jgi:tetratricopeptide (TPR) repeat protein
MVEICGRSYPWIRMALLVLAVVQIGGCDSPEQRAERFYDNGMKLLAAHEGAKAALEFRNAVRLKRNMIPAWKVLAEIDEASRNWPAVVTDLRTIVELEPNELSARLKLGKLLLLAGSSNEALELVNLGIAMDDHNADLHALKATIFYKLENQADATREARTALTLDSANADALMVLATDKLAKGDPKGALLLLQDPSVAQAKNLEVNVGLQLLKIRLFGQTGDTKSAEAALKKLIELSPQEPGYRKLLATFYVEQHRINDAEREMREFAAANSSDPDAVLDLVRFLYTIKKDPAAARQEINGRIAANGDAFPYQMALADLNFAEGDFVVGQHLLEKLISADNSARHVTSAKLALAQTYLSKGNLDPAERLTAEMLRDDPHNVSALKLRASLRLERSQVDAAVTDLLEALNYQPRATDLMILLATAYERSGLIELADKQFADATRTSGWDEKVVLEYAAFLQRHGSISRAEDILTSLNKRRPNDPEILAALAQVRLARQNWNGAQEIAESLRRIDSRGLADHILGTALMGRNKYDEAIAAFRSAYNAAPDTAQAMDSLVNALLKANRKDQATSFLQSVLAKDPNNANALVMLGSIQLSSGPSDQALKNFLAAVKAQQDGVVGYRALADFYADRKDYDEAIKVVRSGIERQPNLLSLHMILASILERKGDYDSAISEYEFMIAKQPTNLIFANNLASLLLDHRTDDASLKKAQSLVPILRRSDIPQFKDTLGWANYRQGDYSKAVALSEEASAALSNQPAARYHLGMAYLAAGQPGKALEQLKRALELAPDKDLEEKIPSAIERANRDRQIGQN